MRDASPGAHPMTLGNMREADTLTKALIQYMPLQNAAAGFKNVAETS
jgi:hypothetical protein